MCSPKGTITMIEPKQYEEDHPDYEIKLQSLSDAQLKKYEYIDIRESVECQMEPIENWPVKHLPLSQWPDPSFQFEKDKKYIIFCAKGIRSYNLVEHLHEEEGLNNIFSLNGGIGALYDRQKSGNCGLS